MKYLIDPERLKQALVDIGNAYPEIPAMNVRGTYITNMVASMIKGGELPGWAEEAPQKPARATKTAKPASGYSPEFEAFWAAYPSRGGVKSGKAPAYKAWQKEAAGNKAREVELLQRCLLALKWQKQTEQWLEERGKYIPMPTTYINQKRFEDEPAEQEKPKDAGQAMDWETFD